MTTESPSLKSENISLNAPEVSIAQEPPSRSSKSKRVIRFGVAAALVLVTLVAAWMWSSQHPVTAKEQFNLGWEYARGYDYTQAVYWYQKAAEQGDAGAQYELGGAYAGGNGVPKDDTQAIYWYRKAAASGEVTAKRNLGLTYEYNDDIQAAYWYQEAAEQGDALAQFELGLMYEYGRGVPHDEAQAVNWYRKAAAQGLEAAKIELLRSGH